MLGDQPIILSNALLTFDIIDSKWGDQALEDLVALQIEECIAHPDKKNDGDLEDPTTSQEEDLNVETWGVATIEDNVLPLVLEEAPYDASTYFHRKTF